MTLHKRIPPIRVSRNLPPATFEVLEDGVRVEKLVDTMLACVAVGALDDGLLPVAVADDDLVVKIPVDLTSPVFDDGAFGRLQLLWNGVKYGAVHQITEDDVKGTDIELTLAKDQLTAEGISTLTYVGTTFPGGDELFGDPALSIEVDRTAPGGGNIAALQFTQDVIDEGVTPAKLDLSDNLPSLAAHWRGLKLGDIVHPILIEGANEVQVDPVTVVDDTPGAPVSVPFHKSKLEAIGDGDIDFTFTLEDRAGNMSNRAPAVTLKVLLDSVPRSWPEPTISPVVAPDNFVGETQARTPVGVVIPADTHFQKGDRVTVHWDNEVLAAEAVDDPTTNPIMTILVPYSAVQKAGDGAKNVVYHVERSNIDIGRSEPPVAVNVDLTLPGGPDPDPDTPEHGNLLHATVTADSGAIDRIDTADFGKDAKITLSHEDKDGKELFLENDVVTVSWGSTDLASHTIVAADVGQDLEQTLTGTQMETEGTGIITLKYAIARPVASKPGQSNTAISPSKDIEVISSAELPGGGSLDTGSFPEANAADAINSEAAASGGGTPFRIDAYTNMAVGDKINFRFIAYDGYLSDSAEVPASEETGERIISSDDVKNGYYEFLVPSAKLYLAGKPGGSQQGRGKAIATYNITNPKGTGNGVPVDVLIDARPLP